jgi:predicted small metal-binding protein
MTKEIKCSELGIKDCDFIAAGETAGDVVSQVVEHLRAEHDIGMPDADAILAGEAALERRGVLDGATVLVVERLTDALNIVPPKGPELPKPALGRTPSS